jgi:pimeloyl-ACP methyl ester carboxylesterase
VAKREPGPQLGWQRPLAGGASKMTTISTRELTVEGVRTPYLETGPTGSPEAVVFVHGNPGSGEDWRPLMSQVGEFARGLAPHMPGFGQAEKPKGFDYTVTGYARHLDAWLAKVGVTRAHLVLHDFGGPWGLNWAAANPHKLASVVLINTGILAGYRWHYLARIWRTPVLGELFQLTTTRPGFRLLLKHGNPRGLPREFIDRMYEDYDRGTRRAILKLYHATGRPGQRGPELSRALRPLNLPALVVWGRHDPYISYVYAERQRETFPAAQVVILDDSGHWPFVDNPGAVAGAVIPFLKSTISQGAE